MLSQERFLEFYPAKRSMPMFNVRAPNLTFPDVRYGRLAVPWDLEPLLYKGGTCANAREAVRQLREGKLGPLLSERIPLVSKLHDSLSGTLAAGGSRFTAKSSINNLRSFFRWADDTGHVLTLATIEQTFLQWTDHLFHRQLGGEVKKSTIHRTIADVGKRLDEATDRETSLLRQYRLIDSRRDRRVLGTQADKQNIEATFSFGNALHDISEALTVEAICGKLPVNINIRTGPSLEEWSGLISPSKLKIFDYIAKRPASADRVLKARVNWELDVSYKTRAPLINLRIECALLTFIAQTGMNLTQAYRLRTGNFSYRSHADGYLVHRVYKGRRNGEVEFEIFSEYRAVFERYLAWRSSLLPMLGAENDLLFPLSSPQGRSIDVPPNFNAVRKRCRILGIRYISPRELRKTRVNWLLRKTKDPAITAEMAQHGQRVLLSSYEQPHHQAAIVEIARFHSKHDPAMLPPGPGLCINARAPELILDAPTEAAAPDCISPAGCLFCTHHRDIDSADHVWSLASYRYFKSIELATYRPAFKEAIPNPSLASIERLTAKIKEIEESSPLRQQWAIEAHARIEEGFFHPKWDGFIQLMEIRA